MGQRQMDLYQGRVQEGASSKQQQKEKYIQIQQRHRKKRGKGCGALAIRMRITEIGSEYWSLPKNALAVDLDPIDPTKEVGWIETTDVRT